MKYPSRMELQCLHLNVGAFWPPPLSKMLCIAPNFKYQFTRGIKYAGKYELISFCHFSSLLIVIPSGNYPVNQTWLPKTAGIVPPSLTLHSVALNGLHKSAHVPVALSPA